MVWGPLIAVYLFLAGAAAGTCAASAYLDIKFHSARMVRLISRVIALVAIGIGLITLMVDAEAGFMDPLRFIYLLNNPESVMTIGVYIISVFMIILCVSIVLDILGKQLPSAVNYIAIILSVCLAAYTGFLLGVATPFALWNNAALPLLFVISGASAGLAIVNIVGRVIDNNAIKQVHLFERSGIVLPIAEAFVLFCMLAIVSQSSVDGASSVASLTSGSYAPLFWGALVVVGLALPLCLEVYRSRAKSDMSSLGFVADAGTLIGGFTLRYLVIVAAVMTLCI